MTTQPMASAAMLTVMMIRETRMTCQTRALAVIVVVMGMIMRKATVTCQTPEERLQEALQTLRNNVADEVTITDLPTDEIEKQFLSRCAVTACGCTKVKGMPCSTLLSLEVKSGHHAQNSCNDLDMVILVQPLACANDSSSVCTAARHQPSMCDKSYTSIICYVLSHIILQGALFVAVWKDSRI